MFKRELSRRSFVERWLIGTAAMAWPQYASATHRRAVDLIVTAIRWSKDLGATWQTDPVLEGSDVWFEADVKNIGLAGARLNTIIQVDFRANGTLVSQSNTYNSGLPAGGQITLRANTGPDGDQFWHDGEPGTYSIQARVDAPNRFPSEHSESNNTRTVQLIIEGEVPPESAGELTPSGPVQASANGQVIQGLDITATGTAHGVRVNGFADVIVRNCRIRHERGKGIYGTNAPRLRIEDCDIICIGAPAAGENPSSGMNCVEVNSSADVRINRVRGRDGSAIIRMLNCPRPFVSFLEGYDVRGPNPRGNLLQWDACHDAVLEDFSIINRGNVATPQDVVSSYQSHNSTIRRGFIHGSNSTNGQCVIFETTPTAHGGLVEDVDAVYWGNGAFMSTTIQPIAAGQGGGTKFFRCRARDGIRPSPNNSAGNPDYQGNPTPDWQQFVGALNLPRPVSGGEAFFAFNTPANVEFHDCQYFNLPRGVAWDQARMSVREFALVNFTPRAPIRLTMPWERSS
jgi:hypothetical protein